MPPATYPPFRAIRSSPSLAALILAFVLGIWTDELEVRYVRRYALDRG